MVLLVFLESENLLKIRQFPNWEICFNGHDTHMEWRASSGEDGGVGFILGGWCNGRRMALKSMGQKILVSMVTNHSYQTDPITIKPPPMCRASGGKHSGVMFMVGGWV